MGKQISLLLSGGLDSSIAYHFAKKAGYEVIPISVDLGHPYHWKEWEAINKLGIPEKILHIYCKVLSKELGNEPTLDNWTIPARNLLLGTIAAMYSSEVWLCALSTEYNRVTKNADKSYEFFLMASGLLTFVCGMVPEEETLRKETLFRSPFKNLSKREIVTWALANGISEEYLKSTASCFSETSKQCGGCATCFNRWVAMSLNGIQEKTDEPPWESKRAEKYYDEMRQAIIHKDYTHYTPQRIYEVFLAVSKRGMQLSAIENAFIDSHNQTYNDKLATVRLAHERIKND